MYSYRFVATVLALGLLIGTLSTFDAVSTAAPSGPAAQDDFQPIVIFAALQQPNNVRYSVAVTKPVGGALRDLRVEVTLPPDAQFVEALETPGYTRFVGQQANTLIWTTDAYPPDEYVDALTFRLASVPSGDFTIRASWSGATSGTLEFSGRPTALAATNPNGDLVLGPQGTAGSFVPAGDSGVLIGASADTLPAGTTLRVRVLGPDANPPAAVAGDLWWCAIVELTGLPPDTAVLVFAPARQPLPPNAWLPLFALRGDTWTELPDRQGLVTFDGQYVAMVHRGGVLAAGTNPRGQPTSSGSSVGTRADQPRFSPSAPSSGGGSGGTGSGGGFQGGLNLGGGNFQTGGQSGNFQGGGGGFQGGFGGGGTGQGGGFQGGFQGQTGGGFQKQFGLGGMLGDPRGDMPAAPGAAHPPVQPPVAQTAPALRVPTTSGPLGVADMLRLTTP
jgi:hypothetical protein